MHTTECSAIKELPFTVNLFDKEERKRLDKMGKEMAKREKFHYKGYVVFTDEPYSVEHALPTLFFN